MYKRLFLLTLILLLALSGGLIITARSPRPERHVIPGLVTNEAFVTGLYSQIDLEDPKTVFGYIFQQLPPQVTVYPSEGYYYVRFSMRGLTIKGSISLFAHQRDRGILEFGYTGEIEDQAQEEHIAMPGRTHIFSEADGLILECTDDFTYKATYQGKVVVFHLFEVGLVPPEKMAPDEVYAGTSFDESGLRFHLLFNQTVQRLYWVLDERHFVPEAMIAINDQVVLGARTRFAFYQDRVYERKLLIGVHRPEILSNTWYDGPFDQLPDTYIKKGDLDIKPYLVAHTGLDGEDLDQYGHLLTDLNQRVPIAAYLFYRDSSELDFVLEIDEATMSRSEFYAQLTAEKGRPGSDP